MSMDDFYKRRGLFNPPRTDNPTPHMSAGRLLVSERYVVGWPDGIVKVGMTWHGRRRWGTFLNRGATMLDRARYQDLGHGLDAEIWLEKQLRKMGYKAAFDQKRDSFPYLGPSGGGWLECLAVPTEDWPKIIEVARAEDALV